jgi:hypothetical protein
MRFMVMVKATKDSEADKMPSEERVKRDLNAFTRPKNVEHQRKKPEGVSHRLGSPRRQQVMERHAQHRVG